MNERDKDFQKEANKAARRAIESMKDDLDALEHSQTCSGETNSGKCKRGSETKTFKREDGTKGKIHIHEDPEAWHDEERAREAITESALSIEVRSGWYSVGDQDGASPSEYRILLGTGGPASQIVGDLDDYKQPTSAKFQYQDWFKPWTDAETTREDEQIMVAWAQNFYFGD